MRPCHRWRQVIGKIRLALAPMVCHCWQVTLYVTLRGLTTSPIPYGTQMFQIDFGFLDHMLQIATADGARRTLALRPRSVADFYQDTMAALHSLGIDVPIWTTTVEVEDRTPFEQDHQHAAYDPDYAQRVWRILAQASRVLTVFRSRFIGKVSPLHFFGAHSTWPSAASRVVRPRASQLTQSGNLRSARSLLARSEQLWILAGRRLDKRTCLVCLCVSGAGGLQNLSDPAEGSVLQP